MDAFLVEHPRSDPKAMVTEGNYRVTVLDTRWLRIEYSSIRRFLDLPTLTFPYRWHHKVPEFSADRSDDGLRVSTEDLVLHISVEAVDLPIHWKFGDSAKRNLRGTARTLDAQCEQKEPGGHPILSPGLLSRDGYYVIDGSKAPVLTPSV
jgi:hypothetical protein